MAQSLYEVFINRIDDVTVEWTVTAVNDHVDELPTTKSFAFSILVDPIYFSMYRKEEQLLESPMAAEADLEDVVNPEWIREHAAGIVDDVTTEAGDDDRLQAHYQVTVTHPGWLEHLRPEMSWETAADDVGPADRWAGPQRRPFDRIEVPAENGDVGFRPLTKTRDNASHMVRHDLQAGWLVPTEGTSYYRAVDPLQGPEITTDKVQQLIGQPVFVELASSSLEPGPIVGVLAPLDDRIVHLYREPQDRPQMAALSLSSIDSIGRAWHIERKLER